MSAFAVRLATTEDVDQIHAIFLEQFPFLEVVSDKAREQARQRVLRSDSRTVVACDDTGVAAVARGYELDGVYLMNSICTAKRLSLGERLESMMKLLPQYASIALEHARELSLERAFYSTRVPSVVAIGRALCKDLDLFFEEGEHAGEQGFWIRRHE